MNELHALIEQDSEQKEKDAALGRRIRLMPPGLRLCRSAKFEEFWASGIDGGLAPTPSFATPDEVFEYIDRTS